MNDFLLQVNQMLDTLFQYGPFWVYLAIMAACFIENIFPPFPGDTFILAAGGLAGASRLDFGIAMAVVVTGGLASVAVLYVFGSRYGRAYFLRKDFRFFSANDVDRVERLLTRYGPLVLISSRFIVGIRSGLAVAAGIGRYPGGRMILYSLISYLLFAGLLMYLSMRFVENFDTIERQIKTYQMIIWPVVIGAIAIYIGRRLTRRKRTD